MPHAAAALHAVSCDAVRVGEWAQLAAARKLPALVLTMAMWLSRRVRNTGFSGQARSSQLRSGAASHKSSAQPWPLIQRSSVAPPAATRASQQPAWLSSAYLARVDSASWVLQDFLPNPGQAAQMALLASPVALAAVRQHKGAQQCGGRDGKWCQHAFGGSWLRWQPRGPRHVAVCCSPPGSANLAGAE